MVVCNTRVKTCLWPPESTPPSHYNVWTCATVGPLCWIAGASKYPRFWDYPLSLKIAHLVPHNTEGKPVHPLLIIWGTWTYFELFFLSPVEQYLARGRLLNISLRRRKDDKFKHRSNSNKDDQRWRSLKNGSMNNNQSDKFGLNVSSFWHARRSKTFLSHWRGVVYFSALYRFNRKNFPDGRSVALKTLT